MGVTASILDVQKTFQVYSSNLNNKDPSDSLLEFGLTYSGIVLGSGEWSIVYKAKDDQLNDFAVKKINYNDLKLVQRRKRILREITILKAIAKISNSSNYFVSLKNAFTDKSGNMFIVTDFIEGFELCDLLKKFPCGVPELYAKKILYSLFVGIDLLHQKDIAHRDIKLENILFDKENNIMKLVDFGFATKTSKISDGVSIPVFSTTYCGSLHYVSPEIVSSTPYDAKKADVWALGVLLVVLLTGSFPFHHSNEQFLLQQITRGIYRMPLVSPEAKSLITLMLEYSPSKRASISDVLNHPWWDNTLSKKKKNSENMVNSRVFL